MAAVLENGESRSLDLGFLDGFDFPDLPLAGNEEMIPVDTFFDNYVENLELGARGSQPAGTISRMDTSDGALLPLPQSLASGAVSLPLTDELLQQSLSQTSSPPASALPMPLPGANGPVTSAPSAAAAMPAIPTTSAASAEHGPRGGRSTRGAGRGRLAAQRDALHHLDHEKTKRNPKQQLQNKQAQQRYRERRKQRFNEMEEALGQLSDQMQAKQQEVFGLQSQNAALQGKSRELEAEVAKLKAQLAAASAAAGPSSSDGHSSGTAASGDHEADITQRVVPASHGALSQTELAQSRTQYDGLVSAMRELAERHDLRNVNPLGEGVAPEVLGQVRELVSACCSASQALDRKGGIAVLEVMGRDVDKVGTHTCAQERQRWGRIMEALRLVPRQEEALLALRKQHLARLKAVYQGRQSLNMQAMGLMLPTPERTSDVPSLMTGGDPTLEGKMACMSISSYLNCARNTLALDNVLDSLKDNLREEQKTFMEMKLVTLHRVLSPIQTLLFMVEAYPVRPDALALSNSVALKMGRAAEGCPKAAELLRAAEAEASREATHSGSGGGPPTGPPTGVLNGSNARTSSTDSHKSDACSLSTGMPPPH